MKYDVSITIKLYSIPQSYKESFFSSVSKPSQPATKAIVI